MFRHIVHWYSFKEMMMMYIIIVRSVGERERVSECFVCACVFVSKEV